MVCGAFGSGKESSSGLDEGRIIFMNTVLDFELGCIIQGGGISIKVEVLTVTMVG